MYAVEPTEVRKAERLTVAEIMERVPDAPHAVLSGGNPALHELGPLVEALHERGMTVSVETQGSRWKEWLTMVDQLVISPKPPSSGMVSKKHDRETAEFMRRVMGDLHIVGMTLRQPQSGCGDAALKIVVFDETDYEWARAFHVKHADLPFFVSAGTPVPSLTDIAASDEDVKREICERYRWLCERVAADPLMSYVRVLPQLHVLAWGTVRGV
jgi:7-carboxy-7-deazaguanine synthase